MKKIRLGKIKNLVYLIVISILSALLYVLLTINLGDIVNFGYEGNLEGMLSLIPTFIGIVILNLLIELLNIRIKASYIKNSLILIKETYIKKLLKQDITQLQKEHVSTYRSQLTQDMDRYEVKFFEQMPQFLSMVIMGIGSIIILYSVNKFIAFAAIVLVVVFGFITAKSGEPLRQGESKKSESLNAYTSFLDESLDGFEVIKQHQLEEVRKEIFWKHAKNVQDDNYELDKKVTIVDAKNMFVLMLVISVSLIGGLAFANKGNAGFGDVIKIIMAFSNVMWPMQQLMPTITQMNSIQEVLKGFDKSLTVPETNRPESVKEFQNINFENADLGYTDPILKEVNLRVQKGEKVLIVGPSGAGKSTILKTMRQSLLPIKGRVNMNQIALNHINALDYYRLFATVDQVGFIFNGTLKENITLHQDVEKGRIEEALKRVHLEELDLNMQLINNGANLSGGQRARLLSARALCLEASIIICDEIFAALDSEVARTIEEDLLRCEQAIVNVSHIYFEENLDSYDAIYHVYDGEVKQVSEKQFLVDEMLKG